jgi:hypothetical protein
VSPSLTKPHCQVFLDSVLLNNRGKLVADLKYIKYIKILAYIGVVGGSVIGFPYQVNSVLHDCMQHDYSCMRDQVDCIQTTL